jgi:hypothetical protein
MTEKSAKTLPEIRLACLDLACQSGRLLGRAENVEQIAESYFEWIMRGTPHTVPVEQPAPGSDEAELFEAASIRQARGDREPA